MSTIISARLGNAAIHAQNILCNHSRTEETIVYDGDSLVFVVDINKNILVKITVIKLQNINNAKQTEL